MKSGASLIADERKRQIEEEGFTVEQDVAREDRGMDLAMAGAAYAVHAVAPEALWAASLWPWSASAFKPDRTTKPRPSERDLIKAGALIAAAIDALHASPAPEPVHDGAGRAETPPGPEVRIAASGGLERDQLADGSEDLVAQMDAMVADAAEAETEAWARGEARDRARDVADPADTPSDSAWTLE